MNFPKLQEIWTIQKIYEGEHFQNTRNCLLFQSAREYDDNVNNVCAKFEYPSVEVRTTGSTRHLNLRRQIVDVASVDLR